MLRGGGSLVTATEEESEGENRRKKCDLHPGRNYFKRGSIFPAVGGHNLCSKVFNGALNDKIILLLLQSRGHS